MVYIIFKEVNISKSESQIVQIGSSLSKFVLKRRCENYDFDKKIETENEH